MIQFFRKLFQSKIGLGITFAFIALVALAFASSDIAGTGTFGGIAGGDRVAVVGKEKIGTGEFIRAVRSSFDRARAENPKLTMSEFIDQGGFDQTLKQLVDRTALAEYARSLGLRAGHNLVNSEILSIPAFRGPDGNFSQDAYAFALRQQGLTDASFREDLADTLVVRQLLEPAIMAPRLPIKAARHYASLLTERRKGAIAFLPSAMFAPTQDPGDEQVKAYYEAHKQDYLRPERRRIRYFLFDENHIDRSIEPTEAEIAARYEQDKQQYAASEKRRLTQVIVPTRQAAETLTKRAASTGSLEKVAREAGFATAEIGPVSREDLAAQSSAEVAQNAFAASRGGYAEPARSSLGWHVIRIDAIERQPARSLAQVRNEIREKLRAEKRAAALADLSSRTEELIDDGAPLVELAQQLKAEPKVTEPLTGDGRVYGDTERTAPAELMPALQTAFQMEEGQPQLAEIVPGKAFLVFEVQAIEPASPPALAEIRDRVVRDWRLAQGTRAAREAAKRILERVQGGQTLAEAIAKEKTRLPPVENINLSRQEILAANRRIPAPLALMFSMAKGSAKLLETGENLGWYLVALDDIEISQLPADSPLVTASRSQIENAMSEELALQLIAAVRKEVDIELNPAAIDAVRRQLVGNN